MVHAARLMEFEKLYTGLQYAAAEGLVRESVGPGGLRLYCYSEKCVYERSWDEITLLARGLVIDVVTREVVATPFPKFFNVGEGEVTIPDLPFETFEKLDGSLIIVFKWDGEWHSITKGSFKSEQSRWAAAWIDDLDLDSWVPLGATLLFEAIYPENRIVVRYRGDMTGLHLLGGYYKDGDEFCYGTLRDLGELICVSVVERHSYSSVSELMVTAKGLDSNAEGFVLRFSNGLRLKIKGDEYCRIHRMVSRLTPLAIWESMATGDDLEAIRRELPEKFWGDFDIIEKLLYARIAVINDEVVAAGLLWMQATDKELGLRLQELPPMARKFIFPWRKEGGLGVSQKSRDALYREIRPNGNALAGYVPGSAVRRVAENE